MNKLLLVPVLAVGLLFAACESDADKANRACAPYGGVISAVGQKDSNNVTTVCVDHTARDVD